MTSLLRLGYWVLICLGTWVLPTTVFAQWGEQSIGLLPAGTRPLVIDAVDPNAVWAVGYASATPAAPYNGFTRTANGGQTWTAGAVAPGAGLAFADLHALSATRAWVAMNDPAGGGALFYTSDGGQTWVQRATTAFAAPTGFVNGIRMLDARTGVATGDPRNGAFEIYTTDDAGTSWQVVPPAALPVPQAAEEGIAGTLVAVGRNVWFGTSAGRVYRSSDAGHTWQVSSTGLAEAGRLAFSDALNGLAYDGADPSSLRRTTDGGQTWATVFPAGAVFRSAIKAIPGRAGAYVSVGATSGTATANAGSSFSYDYGLTWSTMDTFVQHSAVDFPDPQIGWAGGTTRAGGVGGIYKAFLSVATSPPVNYCSVGSSGSCDIVRLSINGVPVSLSCFTGSYVTNYTPDAADDPLLRGNTYEIELVTSAARSVSVWLDANANGQLEASEWTLLTARSTPNATVVGRITVPSTARFFTPLLRLRTSSTVLTGADACTSLFDGQTVNARMPLGFPGGTFVSTNLPYYNGTAAPYCTPVHSGGCDAARLTGVALAGTTLAGTSDCWAAADGNNYVNHPNRGATTAILLRNGSYTFTVNTASAGAVGAWIDWNRDLQFDAGEWVALTTTGTTSTGTVTVPLGAALGSTRLRVRSRETGTSIGAGDACTAFDTGEAEDYTLTVVDPSPDWQWAQRVSGLGGFDPAKMAVDAAGNTYVTGSFNGTQTFGPTSLASAGDKDIFLAKYDAQGVAQWARRVGGGGDDRGRAIAVDAAGNVYLTGSFSNTIQVGTATLVSNGSSDVLVVKYDAAGNIAWVQKGGGTSLDSGSDLAVDNAGNVLVAAYSLGDASFGSFNFTNGPNLNSIVLRYGPQGTLQWARQVRGIDNKPLGIATDGAGNAYVTGYCNGLTLFGTISLTTTANQRMYLAKYDASGTVQWVRQAAGYSDGADVDTDADGSVFVVGQFKGLADFGSVQLSATDNTWNAYIAQYRVDGTVQWARASTGSFDEYATSVAADGRGGAYLAGWFQGRAALGPIPLRALGNRSDVLVARYNATGEVVWVQQAGGTDSDEPYALVRDPNGNVYTSGYLAASATFGSHTVTVNGASALFLARLGDNCVRPAVSAGADQTACGGASLALGTASQAGTTYAWSVQPAIPGFAATQAQPTVTLPVVTTPTVYTFTLYAAASSGCLTDDVVRVTVTPPPAAPTAAGVSRCGAGTLTLQASGSASGSYAWYSQATGGSPIAGASGASYTTPALSATTTYYVSALNGSCESSRQAVTATIVTPPTATLTAAGATALCPGATVTLTATGGSSSSLYQFLRDGQPLGSASTTATYSASQAGTYTVSVTESGCSATSSPLTITANAGAVAVAGPARIFCSGSSAQLGAPAVAGTTYSWAPATGLSSATDATPTVTLTNSGTTPVTTTYTLVATTGQGCSATSSVQVTVNPLPVVSVAASGPLTFCQGGSVTLTAAGGGSYRWSTGATSASITVTTTGTYTVTATNPQGCSVAAAPVSVTVTPVPTAAIAYASPAYCANGANPTPTINGSTGGTFSAPAGLIVDASTGAVNLGASQPGTYQVSYDVAGACPVRATAQLTINAVPAQPTISVAYNGATTTLTSSAAAGNQWYLNGQPVPGATAQTYVVNSPNALGSYTVTSTSASGCTSGASTPLVVTATLRPAPGTSLTLHPNPTTDGRVTVTLTGYQQPLRLTLFNVTGQVVHTATVPVGQTQHTLQLAALPPGVYLLRSEVPSGVTVHRLVRE